MVNITQTAITIMVTNMSKSISFYTKILGFNLLHTYGDHYAQIAAPGINIGLHPSDKKTNPSGAVSIGFTVADFDEAKRTLLEFSIAFEDRKEEGGTFVHFKDPDDTPLYFIIPKNKFSFSM